MTTPLDSAPTDAVDLETIRRRRAELREAFDLLERALAAPATTGWADTVAAAVTRTRGDLDAHIAVTEGPDGLHDAIRTAAPRLSHALTSLTDDHVVLTAELTALTALTAQLQTRGTPAQAEVTEVREIGTRFLAHLARHRQRTSDLVYEGFQTDLGGVD